MIITYTSRQDKRFTKCFKSCVWLNGKPHYHTERGKKTFKGGLNTAKRIAEELAAYYSHFNNDITIQEIE